MIGDKKVIALIPARGGSKGVPGKNIRPLHGKPLIGWAIEQARNSKFVDEVIVSTDDDKISDVARHFGARVPFVRPQELATDSATGIDVVFHALDWLEENGQLPDIVVLLQPTSPFRNGEDIDAALEMLQKKGGKASVAVCETEHSPCWSNTLPADGCMKDFVKSEYLNKNRQELPVNYRINGSMYIAYCDYLREHNGWYGSQTYAYVMPHDRSIDIDTEMDFQIAEFFMHQKAFVPA